MPSKKSKKSSPKKAKKESKRGPHAPERSLVRGKKSILIVEDERPLAHALELKFQSDGFNVVLAADGEEALKEAKARPFSVVLLDLIMPRMDGFTFLEELKKAGRKTRVIILTNLGQDEDRERAMRLGAAGYYVKANTPITEIVKKVKQASS